MKIFKSILRFCFVILHLNSFSQDSEYYKKYIPKSIKSTFVQQIEGVQIDDNPCIRLNCRDGFYCGDRTIKGKSKPFNYFIFIGSLNLCQMRKR